MSVALPVPALLSQLGLRDKDLPAKLGDLGVKSTRDLVERDLSDKTLTAIGLKPSERTVFRLALEQIANQVCKMPEPR